ncbi:hypothetical protein IE81DRAFT_105 [Ceraceosorus guamensis]|uniref:Uncharacterized protein n=1 Tax=Ceraceosorus guamensis TaxID=1522189 RepID=A0A316WEQ3_9BASI|nr:hypothetical protein IE81DRAFT_105 [Ceraceosorus guamensis]PWN46213.1 hypothetical protein IE81DRAFT_105 [Ceraceosorus guamensis]
MPPARLGFVQGSTTNVTGQSVVRASPCEKARGFPPVRSLASFFQSQTSIIWDSICNCDCDSNWETPARRVKSRGPGPAILCRSIKPSALSAAMTSARLTGLTRDFGRPGGRHPSRSLRNLRFCLIATQPDSIYVIALQRAHQFAEGSRSERAQRSTAHQPPRACMRACVRACVRACMLDQPACAADGARRAAAAASSTVV